MNNEEILSQKMVDLARLIDIEYVKQAVQAQVQADMKYALFLTILFGLIVVGGIVAFVLLYRLNKKSYDYEGWFVVSCIIPVLGLVGLLPSIYWLLNIVYSPKFYALKEAISMFRKCTR